MEEAEERGASAGLPIASGSPESDEHEVAVSGVKMGMSTTLSTTLGMPTTLSTTLPTSINDSSAVVSMEMGCVSTEDSLGSVTTSALFPFIFIGASVVATEFAGTLAPLGAEGKGVVIVTPPPLLLDVEIIGATGMDAIDGTAWLSAEVGSISLPTGLVFMGRSVVFDIEDLPPLSARFCSSRVIPAFSVEGTSFLVSGEGLVTVAVDVVAVVVLVNGEIKVMAFLSPATPETEVSFIVEVVVAVAVTVKVAAAVVVVEMVDIGKLVKRGESEDEEVVMVAEEDVTAAVTIPSFFFVKGKPADGVACAG